MSGWSHDPIESIRVNNRQWTDEVRYISELIDHELPSDRLDINWDGQYYACHAEKQLIAYFVDRHVFIPRDSAPDETLEGQINILEVQRESLVLNTAAGQELASLRGSRAHIDGALMAIEDPGKTKELEADLRAIEDRLRQLQSQPRMQDILALERHLNQLNRKRFRHEELMEMANAPPPSSLNVAVILIRYKICDNCLAFRDRVNEFFGLSIQLYKA
jgi:hypothetical protein